MLSPMPPSADDLLVYLDKVRTDADLLSAPPVESPLSAEPWWSWEGVAVDDVDRGLERWTWGLTAWGRETAVTAAVGVLEATMPIWERAVESGAPGTEATVENATRGFNPSPSTLH